MIPKRETVNLVVDRSQGGGYRPLRPVLNNKTMRAMLLRQILDGMLRVVDHYPPLQEITPLRDAIERQRRALELGVEPIEFDRVVAARAALAALSFDEALQVYGEWLQSLSAEQTSCVRSGIRSLGSGTG